MQITIISGKGGTGKTTIAGCLAIASPISQTLKDYDVESPDLGNFIAKRVIVDYPVNVPIPKVNQDKCTLCRACLSCRFNAVALVKSQVIIFEDLCRHCGFCTMICPVHAISEVDYEIGKVVQSEGTEGEMFSGRLNVGEHHPDWILKRLNEYISKQSVTLIDAAPGSGREMRLSVKDSDYLIMVAEPTRFSVSDLELLWDKIKDLNIPAGVVINKSSQTDHLIVNFCQKHNLKILGRIPFNQEIAELSSKGVPFIQVFPEYFKMFKNILETIRVEIRNV